MTHRFAAKLSSEEKVKHVGVLLGTDGWTPKAFLKTASKKSSCGVCEESRGSPHEFVRANSFELSRSSQVRDQSPTTLQKETENHCHLYRLEQLSGGALDAAHVDNRFLTPRHFCDLEFRWFLSRGCMDSSRR